MFYESMYKCRLCEKTYVVGITGSNDIAMENVLHVMSGAPITHHNTGIPVGKLKVHCCEDGSIGIADFQGFKAVEE